MVERAGGHGVRRRRAGVSRAGGSTKLTGTRARARLDAAALAAIRETIEETAIPVGVDPLPDAATAHSSNASSPPTRLRATLLDVGLHARRFRR